MAYGAMASVEVLRIFPVKLAHGLAQVRLDCLQHEMEVIRHQAKAVHEAMVALANQGQHVQPSDAIGIVAINQTATIAA